MPVPSHCCARVRAQPNEPAVQWFPATHVCKLLIDFIDTNVGAFRRNTQASYCLLERARNIARKINSLIEFVEVNDAWDMYDKYTSSIEPLEDCLISLLDTVEKERDQYLITEQLESIDTCITFIEAWATQRADIRAKLEPLWVNTARNLVTDVINKIKDVQSRLATPHNEMEDSSIVLSIKTVMVIYSTMELIKARKPNALWLECAKSEVIWEAAQILLIQLIAHLENGTPQLVDVQNKYNELLSRLQRGYMTGDIRLPPNFPQLMKHAGRIGRSYHAQALYTVALCRELVEHFKSATNKTVQDFELLRLTIDKTLRALNAARLEDGATLTMFDLEAFDNSEISRAFVSARIEIKRCFDKFGENDFLDGHHMEHTL
ncbi:hypothetical protein PHLCEN_2v155 [Hermanssonia centrifuga]|uniref:Uncharacterized protein n=1 Tax=Hermanssonia centrifuga TaxID=98765 RepID=A0A2R6S6S3_9APHY|nr:hypothetical protein PHLCEN_2v155 [Hermanssonia centrifuga]